MDNPVGTDIILTNATLEAARVRTEAALKAEGFGILTEIDVKATLKKKIDVDFKPYVILGACNPHLAHRALTADPSVGLMMPCNVTVRQEGSDAVVSVIDPKVMFGFGLSPDLEPVAEEAAEKLGRVIDALIPG